MPGKYRPGRLLGLEGDMEVVAELERDDQILEEALARRVQKLGWVR